MHIVVDSSKPEFEEIELHHGSLRMYENMVSIKLGEHVVYIHQTTDDSRDFEQKLSVLRGEVTACLSAIRGGIEAAAAHEEFRIASRTWIQRDVTFGIPYPDTFVSSATVCWSVVCEPRKELTVDFRLADCSHTTREYDSIVIDDSGRFDSDSEWRVSAFVSDLLHAVTKAQARYRSPVVEVSKSVLADTRPIS